MIEALYTLAIAALTMGIGHRLGRKSAPVETRDVPQTVHGPGSVIMLGSTEMVLTDMSFDSRPANQLRLPSSEGELFTGDEVRALAPTQETTLTFVDMGTYRRTHEIPEEV